MAFVPDQKFSTFQDGGNLAVNDTIVGLRGGLNTRFIYTGELPTGVIIPIANGGTGASNADDARTNLGLGTMAVQNANAVAITGGTAILTSGSVAASPVAGSDIVNKAYADSLFGSGVASVSGTINRITSTGGTNPVIDIAATYVGQSSITTLGTITSGTWNGSPINLASYVTGNLPVTNLNNGTGASATTFWRGDGTWGVPAGSGVASGQGTANQVLVNGTSGSPQTGALTFTLPQSIGTANAVQFASVRLSNIGILDANANRILSTTATGSAVNYFDIQNAITGGRPTLSAVGSDANIAMEIQGKGTSGILIKGATNGTSTPIGYVGQIISSQIPTSSATNILNATSTNLTSLPLTAGNWLILGAITFLAPGGVINQANAWISIVSATLPDASLRSGIGVNLSMEISSVVAQPITLRLSGATTVYLSGNVGLPSGTCTQCGFLQAIRLP